MQPNSIKTIRKALDFNKITNQILPSIDSLKSQTSLVVLKAIHNKPVSNLVTNKHVPKQVVNSPVPNQVANSPVSKKVANSRVLNQIANSPVSNQVANSPVPNQIINTTTISNLLTIGWTKGSLNKKTIEKLKLEKQKKKLLEAEIRLSILNKISGNKWASIKFYFQIFYLLN